MKNQIRKVLVGSMLIAFALVGGCGRQQQSQQQSPTPADSKPAAQPQDSQDSLEARVDKHGDEVMASPAKAEARQWLKVPSHIFFKADPKVVAQFVEAFYGAGATQVLIADIEEQEGNQYGEALLVVLPKDAAARAKLFEIGARADTAFENDPVSDKGQKYLYYSLD